MSAPVRNWASMAPAELDLAIEQRLAERQATTRKSLFSAFDETGWLAIAPFATVPFMRAAGFGNLKKTLDVMQGKGLVEVSAPPKSKSDQADESVFSMTTAGRAAVIEHYTQQSGGARRLRREVANFASRSSSGTEKLSPPLQRWVELAVHAADGNALAAAFEKHIDDAFRARNAAELLNWIEAARPLVDLASRDLDDAAHLALERAGRRLELLHRRAQDERHLRSFLPRDEQIDALRELVRGPDELWALHLFGVGGVGKTMLLRYLTGYLAPEELKAPTTRIDFDYLNPDYPRLDPGLLLWSFAQELRAYDVNGSATERFDAADQKLHSLYQELSTRRGELNLRPTEHPLFIDAVAIFIDALRVLPQPVIMIVDTCEELAKMRPDGSIPENVEETFRILRALHDGPLALRETSGTGGGGLPGLRVVFAGRRALASAGHGWTCRSSSQPPRPYLRVHELRGFNHDEARRYLGERMRIPEPLIQPVIDKSPDVGSPPNILIDDASNPAAEIPRCNPYDLRLYADWAKEEPPPAPETIRASSPAQYVELRILRRLETLRPLRAILPLIARLKYFDEALVRAVLESESEAALVYDRLRQQEWVDERRVTGLDGSIRTVLSVEEGLRRRLWAYFRDRGELDRGMLTRACNYLEHLTLEAPDLRQLDWASFDATLRALEAEPERAARWWDGVERLIVANRGYDWLLQVTGSLLAPPNAAAPRDASASSDAPPQNPLHAAIMAAFLSGTLHGDTRPSTEVTWHHVLRACGSHPDEEGRKLLEWRAHAGITAATAASAAASIEQVAEASSWMRSAPVLPALAPGGQAQAAAASVAAHEALLDWIELKGGAGSEGWKMLADALNASAGPLALAQTLSTNASTWQGVDGADAPAVAQLVALSCVLAGRTAALAGDYGTAASWFERASAAARSEDFASAGPAWRDWRAPDDPSARVRLEYGRALYPAFHSAAEALRVIGDVAYPAPANNDTDRLASLHLQLRAAIGMPELRDIGALPVSEPRCYSHRVVPPYFAACATEYAARGELSKALSTLRQTANIASSVNLEVVRHAERALARLILRLRLTDQGDRGGGTLGTSPEPADRALIWAINTHAGDSAANPEAPPVETTDRRLLLQWVHALWQTRAALATDEISIAARWADAHSGPLTDSVPADIDFPGASLVLDFIEAMTLRVPFAVNAVAGPVDPRDYWRRNPHCPVEALTLALRASVIRAGPRSALPDSEGGDGAYDEITDHIAQKLGPRRAADIAFEVADHLLLRLPARAAPLFERARLWYESAGDPVGAFLAALRAAIAAAAASSDELFKEARSRAFVACARLPESAKLVVEPTNAEAQLTALATDARAAREWLQRQPVPEWIPTCHRLLACAAPDPGQWVSQVGASLPSTPDLLILSLGRRPADAATSGSDVTEAPSRWQRAFGAIGKAASLLMTTAAALFGLAFTAGLFYGGYALFQGFLSAVTPEGFVGTGTTVSLYLVLLGLIGFVGPAVARQVRSAWASLARATLAVAPMGTAEGYRSRVIEENVHMALTASVARFSWSSQWRRLDPLPTIEADATTGGLVDYAGTASQVPPAIIETLRTLAARAKPRPIDVTVVVRPELQGPCWEGMLQLALAPELQTWLPLRCKRNVPITRSTRHAGDEPPSFSRVLVSLTGEGGPHPISFRAWGELNTWFAPFGRWRAGYLNASQLLVRSDESMDPIASREGIASVLHLPGRVEEDVAGLGFTSGRRESSRGRASGSESGLLRADDIVKRFARLVLVIVQPVPLQEWPAERVPSDREDAARVRAFAAELCTRGVPLVLVLPRLDTPVAAQVLAKLARRLRHAAPTERALLKYVREIQQEIARHPGEPAVAAEAALDVTLFTAVPAEPSPVPGERSGT